LPYYAQFKQINGHSFRFDTQIYLHDRPIPQKRDTENCVAAVVMMNPGSATPLSASGDWERIGADHTLGTVRNRFRDAYKINGEKIPVKAFVQVWNLFYLCDADSPHALTTLAEYRQTFGDPDRSECEDLPNPKFIWFAWGGREPSEGVEHYNSLKNKFRSKNCLHTFYYGHKESPDYDPCTASVIAGTPGSDDFVKHPLYLMNKHGSGKISEHLARCLRSTHF